MSAFYFFNLANTIIYSRRLCSNNEVFYWNKLLEENNLWNVNENHVCSYLMVLRSKWDLHTLKDATLSVVQGPCDESLYAELCLKKTLSLSQPWEHYRKVILTSHRLRLMEELQSQLGFIQKTCFMSSLWNSVSALFMISVVSHCCVFEAWRWDSILLQTWPCVKVVRLIAYSSSVFFVKLSLCM